MPPKPSTVPMRVSVEMVVPATPLRSRNFVCATFGKLSGHDSRGMSRIGVENCSRRWFSHASMAGARKRVRGDWYVPLASKPP